MKKIVLLLSLFFLFLWGENLVDDCSTLSADSDACLSSKEGEVYPNDYCAYCCDENYNFYCMTSAEADKTDSKTWACWYQATYPGSGGYNSTDEKQKESILKEISDRKEFALSKGKQTDEN